MTCLHFTAQLSDHQTEKETEAVRLANRALANALAVSEKDLAEAIEVSAALPFLSVVFLSRTNANLFPFSSETSRLENAKYSLEN